MLVRLVNTAISAGWLILAVIAVRAVCRKAPRSMLCLLWALVAVRLVCPFSLHSPLSLVPRAEIVPERIVSDAAPTVSVRADEPAQAPVTAPEVGIEAGSGRDWALYGTCLWLAGLAALLVYAAVSTVRLRRRVAASVRVKGNIFLCDWIDAPFILGVLRPRIYLPSGMDRERFSYVLAHEHAHLARRDHWWKPLGFALLTVYWFQPLVWAAYILFCRDLELACDERVVRDMGTWDKRAYAEALLSCSVAGPEASVCPVGFGGVGVKARVKAILRYRKPALQALLGMGAVWTVLAVCFLTDPPVSLAAQSPSQTPIAHRITGEAAAAYQRAANGDLAGPEVSKESFAALVMEDEASWGTPMTHEEYARTYTMSLLPLDAAPAGYENVGCVFVRDDPTGGAGPIVDQVLYNWAEQTAIIIQQNETDSPDTRPRFTCSDTDEDGRPFADRHWFDWQAQYCGNIGGVSLNMLMRSAHELDTRECLAVFQSLWPEG